MSRVYRTVPAETLRRQAAASDPARSVWVSANAGSGKTHVLSQRVIRLLLGGTHPSKILCLTYTRAAAANMSNRVFSTLGGWTMLDDAALSAKIAEVQGSLPAADMLRRARRLFAEALETPGGLKIQTIHAFCEAVLHQFPLEANIAGHFEMLDPRMEEVLFAEARRDMLTGAMSDAPRLAEAFALVLERGGEFGLDMLLVEIMRQRERLRPFIVHLAGDRRFGATLFAEFGFHPGETAETIADTAWPVPGFAPDEFARFVEMADQVDARLVLKDIVPAASLAFRESEPVRRLSLLAEGFLTGKGEPYSPKTFKKALVDRLPDVVDRYMVAAQAIAAAADRLAHFRMLEGTIAALTIADWLIDRYERMKSGRGFLDFNDLITRTATLLAREDAGAWVQYKLDQGIDHILLDEAQDTSPDQWAVVRRLAEEFFAGASARDGVSRTIFAVGDEKQSIYSFQGAVPEAFAETGHDFRARVTDAAQHFEHVRLTLSFRSTNDVLHAVDRVFAGDDVRRGVTAEGDEPIRHDAIRDAAPGYVEVWPSIAPTAVEEPDDWTAAVYHLEAPAVQMAEAIASTIALWLTEGETIEGTGKRLSAGDVMVLVRKRDRFVHALSRSLKEKGVAVAGADRLSLPAHIAVKDLIALGRVILQPDDDLSLAALLRSPIFGISEETLFDLAAHRPKGRSLASVLRGRADLAPVNAMLETWANEAAFKLPFDFYSGVLGRDKARALIMARLGPEAGDVLDEFLSFCLAEERAGLPGLEAFLATLGSNGPEVKREMDQGRDEVRIMTVHAAKGLEAPVVFLVDGGAAPVSDQHVARLLAYERPGSAGTGFLWRSAGDVANVFSKAVADRAKARADDEYRRLLYVGMTRAEDRLIVCGYHGRKARAPTTWHSLVGSALSGAAESTEILHPVTGGTICRFRVTQTAAVAPAEIDPKPQIVARPLPKTLFDPLPAEDDLPKPLSPSAASVGVDASAETVPSNRSPVLDGDLPPGLAVQRGIAMHKLLQMLPALPEPDREAAALRYLARSLAGMPDADRRELWSQAAIVLADPRFADAFSPSSRAEVSLMGELTIRGRPRVISGKIDRLSVEPGRITILDYKTNRPAPHALADVPQAYVVQLALYRALLMKLYPGRPVSAALLFTEVPNLIDLPAGVMDEALARLTQE